MMITWSSLSKQRHRQTVSMTPRPRNHWNTHPSRYTPRHRLGCVCVIYHVTTWRCVHQRHSIRDNIISIGIPLGRPIGIGWNACVLDIPRAHDKTVFRSGWSESFNIKLCNIMQHACGVKQIALKLVIVSSMFSFLCDQNDICWHFSFCRWHLKIINTKATCYWGTL